GEWPADGLPFIDPDVIGPDDFWSPVKKPNQPDPDQAFDIWLKRREWIDARIGELNNIARKQVHNVSVPDLEEMFHALSKQIQYGNFQSRPWTIREHEGFQEIAVKLNGGNEEDVKKTISDITNNLYLTVDSFNRLMQIWEKEQRWEANAVNESLTEDEWRELISILVQVRKVELFPVWWQEEIDWQADPNNAALGPEQFWVSAREPAEGDWPPIKDHPFIDPEQVDSNALPEWEVGAKAYELWQQRRDELDQVFRELKAAREQNGFQAMVARALAEPAGDINAIPHDLDLLYHQLNNPDPQVVSDAEKAILDDLYMSLEDFARLMTVHQKQHAAETVPNVQNRPRPPSEEEWHEVYAILTTSEKRFRKYAQGQWSQEETDAGLLYWTALKARLPRWRASANARSTWQETLRIRSKAALINPDVIGPGDIVNPRQGDAAYDIWADRDSELSTRQGGLKQIRELVGNELAGLDDICQSVFGENKTSAFLAKLNDERNEGNDIAPRLAQLNLEQNEFATLLRLRSSIKAGGPLPEAQWQDVYALLVTVAKRRMTAQWRREEKDAQISLTPNMFVVSEDTPEIFIHLEPGSRKDRRARHKWQEVLQTRIDQAQAVSEALAEAVSATEETALPLLRNALIMACDAPGNELGEKAKWLMDRLLVDTQASGCQQTTRIAQAIETIQGLLWSIRTGQLEDTYPGLQLPADNFDEEWEWIGSYATWRAAMFVFLYPENILIPSLRKRQSRGFRNLVSGLRNNNRLTPEMACRAATSYSEHFRDICHLTVEATCHASTRAYLGACRDKRDAGYRNLFYMFGRGQKTNTVYWSAYDPDDESGYAQSFWEPIEGMKDVIKLIGAVPYEIDSSERFIFLFAIVQEDESQKLAFVKYNLEQPGEWSSEPILLEELPEEATVFTAVVKQHQRANNPPHLAVRVPSGAIYDRKLNPQGSDWEDEPEHELVSAKKGSEISALHAMVETGENEFSLFVSDYSGRLRYSVKRQELLGLKSGPAACFVHSHSKRMDVFVRGQDDDLWQTWWHEGQTWQEWKSLGGHLTSDPAVVSDAYFSFHIFALGANNVLLHKYSVNKSWSNWNSLGGEWCSRPAVTSWGHDRIDVFVRGLDDNALYHKWFDGSVWSQELVRGGGPHGGVVNSAPAAISLGNGLIDVFVLGDDDRLWHISYDEHNGGWSQNWEMIEGGPWTSPPTVTSLYSVMDIFIRGEDAALWHIGANRWTGSWQWQNPESWGGILASPPAAIAIRKPHGRQPDEYFIHVFARGTDNFIWHGQWSMTGHRLVSATEWTGFIETVGEEVGENKELIWHTFGIGTWLGAFQWAQSDEVYAFWRNRGHQTFYTTISNHQKRLPLSSGQGWIESMAVHAGGSASGDRTRIAYEKYASWVPYRYRCVFEQLNATLVESDTLPIAPRVFPDVPDPFVITESMTAEQLQQRRHQLESIFYEADNSFWPDTIRAYIEEAYYFVPVFLALQLQRRRHFVAALDWFRNVYDYSRQVDEPKIYYGLKQEDNFSTSFNRVAEWLLDPLNPHAIASTRANTYTHFTLLSLVRCFLDYADDEFTRDTAESVPRARTLYHTALELLSLPVLNQRLLPCQDVIGAIDIQIGEAIRTNAPQWLPVWERVKEIRSRINNMNAQRMASEELRNILGTDASWDERLANAQAYVDEMADVYSKDEAMSSVLSENGEMAAGMHGALFAHDDIYETTRSLAEVVGRDFSKAVSFVSGIDEETLAKEPKVELPWLRNPAISDAEGHGRSAVMLRSRLQGGGATNMSLVAGRNRWSDLTVAKKWPTSYVPAPIFHFCIPPNPVLMGLRLHAELNLFKLRTCRNISGMERQLDPYAAPTDTVSGLPTIGPGGQLTLPGTVVYRMTPYRYTTLIERAKQLVQFATQIESAMLSALEKREAEYYNLLIARQDVKFTRAGIRLQDLRVREAEGGVVLAELQRDQAQIRIGHYEKLLREGLSGLEGTAIGFMVTSAALQTVAAGFHTAAAASYLSPLSLSSHFTSTAAVFSSLAGASSTIASIIST
ncbi:hypothetical protein KAR10_02840, partial [bacterium]|nr:hypothetical protein [bacterium]